MEIIKLDNLEEIQDFIIDVFHSCDNLGYSDAGAASFESFVKEKTGSFTFYGALEKKELIGVLGYDEEKHHITLLFVKKDHQRHGVAKELFSYLSKQEEERQVSTISVHAADKAMDVYKALGFEIEGEIEEAGGITYCTMEYHLGQENLGKIVTVIVEHTIGENHPLYPDTQYFANYGYVEEVLKQTGEFQNAYIYGVDEPVDSFRGIVIAMIYRKGEDGSQWVVGRQGETIHHSKIQKLVGFQEQFYDTKFIFADEQ